VSWPGPDYVSLCDPISDHVASNDSVSLQVFRPQNRGHMPVLWIIYEERHL